MYNIDFKSKLAKYGLNESTYENCIRDIHEKVLGDNDVDWIDIVNKYNIPMAKDSVRKASSNEIFGSAFVLAYFRWKEQLQEDAKAETLVENYGSETAINKDGTYSSNKLIHITENDLKDKNVLLKAHGFDCNVWDLVSAKNSVWNAYNKQSGVRELYSSKITVKPKAFAMTTEDIERWFSKLDRTYSIPALKDNSAYFSGNKLLLIDIADLHFNLYATTFTTGNEYNCDIAERLFFKVIEDILYRTKDYKFKKIIFCVGGDMLNADNLLGTTTKGTPQSNELHLYEAYERLCSMTIKAIDILSQKAPVDVIYVPGNHDSTCGFMLANYINAWFRNDNMVSVDYSPLPRKYVKFGKTLFVFAHDGNVKTLPRIIPDEARECWSKIETTEVFLQHLHTEQLLLEDNNMRIQRLPTISGKSEWANQKGYSSKRQAKSFIFDIEDGLSDVLYTTIKI